MVTMIGLGANRPQDAIYPTATKDDANKDLDASSNKYIIHFDKGQLPPAKGFWSITMYDKDFFFVPNELKRQTLSSHSKFVTNADGSVDLYLQADSPGKDKEANWLPAPKAKFAAMMRLYCRARHRLRSSMGRGSLRRSRSRSSTRVFVVGKYAWS